jgi:RNA polymerase sigma-70 factor (ECF subfamily)
VAGLGAADFSAFYDANQRRLVAQLFVMLGNRQEAEDAAQEAFVRAWARWARVSGYTDPYSWVLIVAHRVAISRWRRAQVAVKSRHRFATPEQVDFPETVAPDVVSALRRLPAAQQRALVLHHMADRSIGEIAAAEAVPEGTIKARLSRGRAALAQTLDAAHGSADKRPLLSVDVATEGSDDDA